MLTTEAAGTILAIAKGAVKITRRIDQTLAEKEAAQQPIALPVPNIALGPTPNQMKVGLTALLAQPFTKGVDPLGADRSKIEKLLAGDPTGPLMFPFVQQYLPSLAIQRTISLNGAFVTAIKQSRPDWASDPDLITAAFYVGAGADFRSQSYTWQLAMTVVQVLAEFGAENTALFTRNERVQAVTGAVLQRFASSDLSQIDSTRSLLRTVLKSTLNGVLDAQKSLDIDNLWVNALLNAVVTARASAADPDDFVVGLFQGRGYPQLVANLMQQAAGVFGAEQANAFEQTAATFLSAISGILKTQPSFEEFFNDHWGEIVQAGLASVAQHGPQLLAGQSPLLGKILVGVAGTLSEQPASKLLSKETLTAIVNATIGVVAANPGKVKQILGDQWLGALVASVASTISSQGVASSFTKAGLDKILSGALTTFGENPHLIVKNPGLVQDLVGGILTSIGQTKAFNAQSLGDAAVSGALRAIAANPQLLGLPYPAFVASLAGNVGTLVSNGTLSGIQGRDLLAAVIDAVKQNPRLLSDLEDQLVDKVVSAVIAASGGSNAGLLAGAALVDAIARVVGAIGAHGESALQNHPIAQFEAQLTSLLAAGLARADAELGRQIGAPALPGVLGQLVVAWSQGTIATVDPDNPNFQALIAKLAQQIQADTASI